MRLEKAFEIYPEVKLVVIAHLYGTPEKIDELTGKREALQKVIDEMRTFTKQSIPLFGYPQWGLITRMRTVSIHSMNPLSFGVSYVLNSVYKSMRYGLLRPKKREVAF